SYNLEVHIFYKVNAKLKSVNIYIMYHGTPREAAARIKWEGFRQSSDGMFGYPLNLPEYQRVIVRVKVNVGRVKKIDYQGHPMQKTWHDQRYDTTWCPPNCGMVPSGLEEDCVWDPRRITVIDVILPNIAPPHRCGSNHAPWILCSAVRGYWRIVLIE
uniref:Grass carp reovirus (GCRV)-induced gene 2j n=1 Tax=Sinocyclocheilus rhinocerous TaxID=307959 RepID=A0A673KPS1_9TELE